MIKKQVIMFCKQCQKPMTEGEPHPSLKETGIQRCLVSISKGSYVFTDEEQSIYLEGAYCSIKCLINKIIQGKKEELHEVDEYSFTEFMKSQNDNV